MNINQWEVTKFSKFNEIFEAEVHVNEFRDILVSDFAFWNK